MVTWCVFNANLVIVSQFDAMFDVHSSVVRLRRWARSSSWCKKTLFDERLTAPCSWLLLLSASTTQSAKTKFSMRRSMNDKYVSFPWDACIFIDCWKIQAQTHKNLPSENLKCNTHYRVLSERCDVDVYGPPHDPPLSFVERPSVWCSRALAWRLCFVTMEEVHFLSKVCHGWSQVHRI